jgi:hypothetical protein
MPSAERQKTISAGEIPVSDVAEPISPITGKTARPRLGKSPRVRALDRRIRFEQTTRNVALMILGGLVLVFSVVPYCLPDQYRPGWINSVVVISDILLVFLIGMAWLVLNGELKALRDERKIVVARKRVSYQLSSGSGPSSADSYFEDLVKINLKNLAAYYELVKIQTDKSFRATLSIAYFGAFLIITGLILQFVKAADQASIPYIASGAGVLTEFIASVFFWLYSKTVSQLRGYHDSLISVQNILLSFKLASDTKDETKKAEMLSQICGFLVSSGKTAAVPTEPPRATA